MQGSKSTLILHIDVPVTYVYPHRNNSECAPDMLLVVAGVISTRSAACCSEGVGELPSLLMDMVEGCTAVLMGQKPQPSPSASDTIVQALLGSVHPDLPLAVVLSAPHLVDSIMALHWDGLTDNVSSKLVALIDGLFEHFQRYAFNNLCEDLAKFLDFTPTSELGVGVSPSLRTPPIFFTYLIS